MKQDKNLTPETQEQACVNPKPEDTAPQAQLQSGEKVFHVVLFAVGLLAFILALQLWFQMSEPRISSAAALPLFVSGAWTLMALIGIIENFKMTTPLTYIKDASQRLHTALKYAFPKEVLVLLIAILVYCILLFFKVSFYISTPLFFYGGMCYLMRGNYIKNILWTAVVMAFIIVVFRLVFGVVFP